MKKILLIYIILFSYNSFSQEIIWKNVDSNVVRPQFYETLGSLYLKKGDVTPIVDLLIDFDNEVIYYRNDLTNNLYNIFEEDFKAVSIINPLTPKLAPYQLYGEIAEEIKSSIRRPLYNNPNLNEIHISSTIKKGFFNRSKPKFYMNENNDLDVENKEIIKAKLLQISPKYIEFLDENGDIILQSFKKKKTTDGATDTEQAKQVRKTTRILNIKLGNNYYLTIQDLYNIFYTKYEKQFYESLETFKSDFLGMSLKNILSKWGPHTEEFVIDDDSKMYIWSFKQKLTEHESSSTTYGTERSALTQVSQTNINASLSSQYGIDTQTSKINLGGYGSVMDSYSEINGKSYLNWYSENIINQYQFIEKRISSESRGISYEVDATKKIALIVDNNLIIKEVLEKNFFPEPYYGVSIKFY